MLKKEASAIVGGLSTPGKMPCYSINLPATACKVGSILAHVPGTTCHGCYALKGGYRFNTTKRAMARRLRALTHGSWTRAMTALITGHKYFRWHDAGDIQSAKHLTNIFEVCNQTPATRHWLPTREAKFLKFIDPDIVPANLIIRLSGHMVDGKNATWWPWTSAVSSKTKTCPAKEQGNRCLDCRSCWDREVTNVTYPKH